MRCEGRKSKGSAFRVRMALPLSVIAWVDAYFLGLAAAAVAVAALEVAGAAEAPTTAFLGRLGRLLPYEPMNILPFFDFLSPFPINVSLK